MRSLLPIATGLNVLPLQLALKRQEYLWNENKLRTENPTSPHRDADDIWVRFNPKGKALEEHISEWYPAYYALPEVSPIVFDVMRMVNGEQLGGVLLTRVPPGKSVHKHIDSGWHASYYDKYIVQIEGNCKQGFHFNDGFFSANPGDVYWFDNSKEHWVTNESSVDRISLIICIRNNRQKVIT
jgi:uncharacterized cupin superfamily protein